MLFDVASRLGFVVRTTRGYWALITTVKHPNVKGCEEAVIRTLRDPDQVRVSKTDNTVYLFYRKSGTGHLCVVTKRITRDSGFIMTAYITGRIKEGDIAWKK